jgi:hypothetical protein
MAVLWDITPCSLVDVDRRFRGAYSLMLEGLSSSETSVSIYQTAGC